MDRNFGGTLVFWDKLLARFRRSWTTSLWNWDGRAVATDNIFWANNLPWLKLLGIRLPELKPNASPAWGWMWTAGLLSFAILLMYIHAEVAWPLADRNLLLGYGTISALTIGGLSEGRAWGLWGWSLIHLTALGFWVHPCTWQDPVIAVFLVLAILHAASTWRSASWAKAD